MTSQKRIVGLKVKLMSQSKLDEGESSASLAALHMGKEIHILIGQGDECITVITFLVNNMQQLHV
jgi:phage protein D